MYCKDDGRIPRRPCVVHVPLRLPMLGWFGAAGGDLLGGTLVMEVARVSGKLPPRALPVCPQATGTSPLPSTLIPIFQFHAMMAKEPHLAP